MRLKPELMTGSGAGGISSSGFSSPSGGGSTGHRLTSAAGSGNDAGGDDGSSGPEAAGSLSATSGVAWQYFDEKAYVAAGALKPGENAYTRNKFNQEASDKLASNRDVPDTRSAACKKRDYSPAAVSKLPPTSVIITFHNEARSTLLGTIVR